MTLISYDPKKLWMSTSIAEAAEAAAAESEDGEEAPGMRRVDMK
jgi:hypothetical protein